MEIHPCKLLSVSSRPSNSYADIHKRGTQVTHGPSRNITCTSLTCDQDDVSMGKSNSAHGSTDLPAEGCLGVQGRAVGAARRTLGPAGRRLDQEERPLDEGARHLGAEGPVLAQAGGRPLGQGHGDVEEGRRGRTVARWAARPAGRLAPSPAGPRLWRSESDLASSEEAAAPRRQAAARGDDVSPASRAAAADSSGSSEAGSDDGRQPWRSESHLPAARGSLSQRHRSQPCLLAARPDYSAVSSRVAAYIERRRREDRAARARHRTSPSPEPADAGDGGRGPDGRDSGAADGDDCRALAARLEQERAERRERERQLEQLQTEYEQLVTKYAEAETFIDRMRFRRPEEGASSVALHGGRSSDSLDVGDRSGLGDSPLEAQTSQSSLFSKLGGVKSAIWRRHSDGEASFRQGVQSERNILQDDANHVDADVDFRKNVDVEDMKNVIPLDDKVIKVDEAEPVPDTVGNGEPWPSARSDCSVDAGGLRSTRPPWDGDDHPPTSCSDHSEQEVPEEGEQEVEEEGVQEVEEESEEEVEEEEGEEEVEEELEEVEESAEDPVVFRQEDSSPSECSQPTSTSMWHRSVSRGLTPAVPADSHEPVRGRWLGSRERRPKNGPAARAPPQGARLNPADQVSERRPRSRDPSEEREPRSHDRPAKAVRRSGRSSSGAGSDGSRRGAATADRAGQDGPASRERLQGVLSVLASQVEMIQAMVGQRGRRRQTSADAPPPPKAAERAAAGRRCRSLSRRISRNRVADAPSAAACQAGLPADGEPAPAGRRAPARRLSQSSAPSVSEVSGNWSAAERAAAVGPSRRDADDECASRGANRPALPQAGVPRRCRPESPERDSNACRPFEGFPESYSPPSGRGRRLSQRCGPAGFQTEAVTRRPAAHGWRDLQRRTRSCSPRPAGAEEVPPGGETRQRSAGCRPGPPEARQRDRRRLKARPAAPLSLSELDSRPGDAGLSLSSLVSNRSVSPTKKVELWQAQMEGVSPDLEPEPEPEPAGRAAPELRRLAGAVRGLQHQMSGVCRLVDELRAPGSAGSSESAGRPAPRRRYLRERRGLQLPLLPDKPAPPAGRGRRWDIARPRSRRSASCERGVQTDDAAQPPAPPAETRSAGALSDGARTPPLPGYQPRPDAAAGAQWDRANMLARQVNLRSRCILEGVMRTTAC